jgi:DNA-binding transcriptional ArsR family regulator
MGLSKKEKFSASQNLVAAYAKALGHPARIAILEFLAEHKSCFCGVLVKELPLSQSTVSQHLRTLKQAGLIKGEIEGPAVCYCIDKEEWEKAKALVASFFAQYHASESSQCC